MQIEVTGTDLEQCLKFATSVAQSDRQFGSAASREDPQRVLDTFEGKVAEVVIRNLARLNGIEVELDFELYPEGVHDNGSDLLSLTIDGERRVPNAKIDVKAIAAGSRWLLVERHKYGPEWATHYALVLLGASRDDLSDYCESGRGLTSLSAVTKGWVRSQDLFASDGRPYVEIPQGGRLRRVNSRFGRTPTGPLLADFREAWPTMPELGPKLDAPMNYGMLGEWLDRDIPRLLRELWTGGAR
jgi:hypothetical protein